MLPTTILIDDAPRCVVRPTDSKDLNRFIRNGKAFLLAERVDGKITHRPANESELGHWRNGLALHEAWGGSEEDFFGLPLPG
ncbi:hypothetical protein [Bradyrhizobium cosmicum]|uniref:hypothetical protein n=1 Tax=Bradyrhizobium cosmicum TaxID=1404864 RepID=UPI001164EC6B|nr:hypothetical protein [Bradyrhizobium cosmicum]QDP25337.1 hypothetical protein FNV92_25595 [Bradyrhizobium cosmicum]